MAESAFTGRRRAGEHVDNFIVFCPSCSRIQFWRSARGNVNSSVVCAQRALGVFFRVSWWCIVLRQGRSTWCICSVPGWERRSVLGVPPPPERFGALCLGCSLGLVTLHGTRHIEVAFRLRGKWQLVLLAAARTARSDEVLPALNLAEVVSLILAKFLELAIEEELLPLLEVVREHCCADAIRDAKNDTQQWDSFCHCTGEAKEAQRELTLSHEHFDLQRCHSLCRVEGCQQLPAIRERSDIGTNAKGEDCRQK